MLQRKVSEAFVDTLSVRKALGLITFFREGSHLKTTMITLTVIIIIGYCCSIKERDRDKDGWELCSVYTFSRQSQILV